LNADENMKFDKNGKPRPWTADELRDFFGFDEDTDEVEFHGDRPRKADYRPPPVTFHKQKRQWPNRLKKMIQEAADSIRECAGYSLDLNERIECLKRAKRDYQDMLLGFSLQFGALLERGVNKYELIETMEAVKSYIDETDRALRESIDEYRNGPEPAEQGGQKQTAGEKSSDIFRNTESRWAIRFRGGETHYFKELKGFALIYVLLSSPEKRFTPRDLEKTSGYEVDKTEAPTRGEYHYDEQAIREMIARKEEIEAIPGWGYNDSMYDEHRRLIEELTAVKRNHAYFRDANDERARRRVSEAIITARRTHIERIDPPCGKYLETTVKNKHGHFCYDPSLSDYRPTWTL